MNLPRDFSATFHYEYTDPVLSNGAMLIEPRLRSIRTTLYTTSVEFDNAVSALGIAPIPETDQHVISKTLRAMADIAEFIEKERACPTASKS